MLKKQIVLPDADFFLHILMFILNIMSQMVFVVLTIIGRVAF